MPMLPILAAALALTAPAPVPFVLDADTANEMDDMYAVAHAVLDPAADLLMLSSAHFNNTEIATKGRWHGYDVDGFVTVAASQAENERLTSLLGSDVPTPLGADEMIGYSWGYFDGASVPDAPAVQAIIERARALPDGERLSVLAVGPATNVAAALIRAPDIAGRLDVWFLGAKYDRGEGIWNKNSFNVRNDLNAFDYVLGLEGLRLTIMPEETARELMFQRERSERCLAASPLPVAAALAERWDFVDAGAEWTMWDLALTMAVAHPEWATIEERPAPPENGGRSVRVVTRIDAPAMEARFWRLLDADCDAARTLGPAR